MEEHPLGRTLRKKIILGYSAAILLILVVLGWAFYNIMHLGRASEAILKKNYNSIRAADHMIAALERQDRGSLLLLLGYASEGWTQFSEMEARFLQWFGRAQDNITEEGEREIIETVQNAYTLYLEKIAELRLLSESGGARAASFYHEAVSPASAAVRDACFNLKQINEAAMLRASSRAKSVAHRAVLSMLVVGLGALGLGLVFSFMLSNFLTRPLRHLVAGAKAIAKGNYDVEITSASSDELGRLAEEFNEMARKLKGYHDLNIGQLMAEKKKSEAIISGIDDGIVVFDADFRVLDINPAGARALGFAPEAARGRHVLEVLKDERLFQRMRKTAEAGEPPGVDEEEDVITIVQGETSGHYQYRIVPIASETGTRRRVVLHLRDITRLKELDRLKSEFVMTASHELRTPLTSIGMGIELLKESAGGKLGPDEQKLLGAAHEEIQRLKALVNDLLTLSKIESGKIEMEFEPASLPALFAKIVADSRVPAERKSVDLSWTTAESLPPVKADIHKIAWVLTNLVGNALNFTASGGFIRLSAEQIGPLVYIHVQDNGSGIPVEFQSRIFDKFIQVGDRKGGETSGLGLAISREIIRAHGGTIWVDSEPGEGSTFTFTLPAAS
jgi:NtrC-family two-component system sensor histidine kinase KinB